MKKILTLVLALVLAVLPVVGVAAAEKVTEDNHKSSFQTYADNYDGLKYVQQPIFGFDTLDDIYSKYPISLDTQNKKEGSASLAVSFNSDTEVDTAFETTNGCFENFAITDTLTQTVKFWVYINDIDLLYCDHDGVYDTPQKDSGTLYIDFAANGGTSYKYSLQHTLEGDGWHYVEIAFNTHNVLYETWKKMNLTKLGFMRVRVKAYKGLELKFDGLEKFTYSNEGYTEPECPKGGRWISTCDYEALDGSILTEWYASSFDLEDKVQGSSSVSITGKKQHVDYRCVWGGVDVPIKKQNDYLHFDIYLSDLELIGTDFQARLSQSESGKGMAHYSFGYDIANKYANAGTGLENGWNSVDIPLIYTKSNIDTTYYKNGIDFRLDHVVFFWSGTSTKETYTIKYDNMYIYTPGGASSSASSSKTSTIPPATSLGPKDGSDEESGSLGTVMIVVIVAAVLAVITAVVILFVLPKTKNKDGNAPKEVVSPEMPTDIAGAEVQKPAEQTAEPPQNDDPEQN